MLDDKEQLKKQIIHVLSIWQMLSDNQSVAYDFDKLLTILSSSGADAIGLRNILKSSNLIAIKSDGSWVLTETGIRIKKDIEADSSDADPIVHSTDLNWTDFRRLLKYYIACINAESRTQYYLRPEKYGRDYFIPGKFDPLWLQDIDEKPRHHVLSFDSGEASMYSAITNSCDSENTVFLGYPVWAYFDSNGNPDYYVPLALIPVINVQNPENTVAKAFLSTEITLDFSKVSFNTTWVERCVPREYTKELYDVLDELNTDGRFDLKKSLPIIMGYSNIDHSDFDSMCLDQHLPSFDRSARKRKLCNTAMFFKAVPSLFTKSLLRELNTLVRTPANILDRTALAYIFRNPPLENKSREKALGIPFIDSNAEQLDAVDKALSYPIVQLQGPPGTGKSQVAVNLIANCIYRGETVLFSSRNHSAVNAIRDRAKTLLNDDFSMIQFCIDEESDRVSWYRNDYKRYQSDLIRLNRHEYSNCQIIVDAKLEMRKEISRQLVTESEARDDVAAILEKLDTEQMKLQSLLEMTGKDIRNFTNDGFDSSIDILNNYTASGIKGLIYRLFCNREKVCRSRDFLKDNYGRIFSDSRTIEDFQKKARYLNDCFDSYSRIREEARKQRQQYDNCKIENREELIDSYIEASIILKEKSKGALISEWNKRISELSDDDFSAIDKVRQEFFRNSKKLYDGSISIEEQLISIDNIRKQFVIEPAWSTTLLSMWLCSPFLPAIFDQVIIDESSQCDIVSIIPALYRARRAIFIGDPQQFAPIIQLSGNKHEQIWKSYMGEDYRLWRFNYRENAAYDLFNGMYPNIMLKEHFRCDSDIADYFNNAFYNNQLRVCTDRNNLDFPSFVEDKNHIQWIDVKDSMIGEMDKAVETVIYLRNAGYKGSIGVCSPLREVVDNLKIRIISEGFSEDDVYVNTAYGFQGGQKDVMIFVIGLNSSIQGKKLWYVTSKENRNIYNVAISRAKALLYVIGDRDKARASSLRELSQLAEYPRNKITTINFESPWEEKLYNALQGKSIITETQRPVIGYRLDLSYEDNYIKLDIEVDGVRYHLDHEGHRKQHDIDRDLALAKYGWKVIRFFVSDLQENMDYCVLQVDAMIKGARARTERADRKYIDVSNFK